MIDKVSGKVAYAVVSLDRIPAVRMAYLQSITMLSCRPPLPAALVSRRAFRARIGQSGHPDPVGRALSMIQKACPRT
jgi:hypothetical protein